MFLVKKKTTSLRQTSSAAADSALFPCGHEGTSLLMWNLPEHMTHHVPPHLQLSPDSPPPPTNISTQRLQKVNTLLQAFDISYTPLWIKVWADAIIAGDKAGEQRHQPTFPRRGFTVWHGDCALENLVYHLSWTFFSRHACKKERLWESNNTHSQCEQNKLVCFKWNLAGEGQHFKNVRYQHEIRASGGVLLVWP